MPVWIVLGVCAAVFFMVVAVAGSLNLFNGGIPAPRDERPRRLLRSDFVTADLDRLAFSPAVRGYRMDEVDAVIGEMAHRIRLQNRQIAVLEGSVAAGSRAPGSEKAPGPQT